MEHSTKKVNLMMVAAHHRQVYQRFISSEITKENLTKINADLPKSVALLREARDLIFEMGYLGKEHTMVFRNRLAQEIDKIVAEVNYVNKLVNQTESTINLADYPLK